MPSNPLPSHDGPDKDLALWMLRRMQDSEEFIALLRKARRAGSRDMLDQPTLVAPHLKRLGKLFTSETEDDVAASPSTAAKIATVMERDLLSSPEEFIEKALEAYLEKHPRGAEGLPDAWQSTFEAARAEIEGRTSGAFEPGFAASLAAEARKELALQAERDRGAERGERES